MKLKFLCTTHREWLNQQPHEAIKCCSTYSETGWQLYQQQRWEDALSYMGCAFETAAIVLVNKALAPEDAREWFVHTLSGLIQTLMKLKQTEICEYLYQKAIDELRQIPAESARDKINTTVQINQLAKELRCLRNHGDVTVAPVHQLTQSQWSSAVH